MTTTPNPYNAFLQMQKARATNAAIAAAPRVYAASESPDFKVKIPQPTLAATGEQVDLGTLVDVDPTLGADDLQGLDVADIMATDAELTALSGKIDDDGTWTDEPTEDDGSWMPQPGDIGLHWTPRLRRFMSIDPLDAHEAYDNQEEYLGLHLV